MMNDSVREELQTSVSSVSGSLRAEPKLMPQPASASALAPPPKHVVLEKRPQTPAVPSTTAKPVRTAPLPSPKTSPTLVDFQAKNSMVPEWRLQVQNAVRQRLGSAADESTRSVEAPAVRASLGTRVATALKAEMVQAAEPTPELADADPRLAAALRRLSESKKTFSPERIKKPFSSHTGKARQFPFNVVAPTPSPLETRAAPQSVVAHQAKPSMVTPLRMEKRLDTNKLPLIDGIMSGTTGQAGSEIAAISDPEVLTYRKVSAPLEFSEAHRIVINAEHHENEMEEPDEFEDGIEDLAPFSMRFNAGLFDLIIGVFASLILLSPIALAGGSLMTMAGLLTFVGTCAIVLFLYTTASLGFFGKTLGMRLFSLELVDAEENEYPTIHQAAVSSSLYILSLACGGLGFLSVFFNEEKRAVHDLLSGTIIVREF
ncbi:MAG: RDD family protein [Acidobacteriota bacterium]